MKVERRDGSKGIKKGGENPRKISLGALRREQGKTKDNRGGKRGGGKPERGGKGGGRGKRFRKGGKKPEPKTAESLDKDLENYWVKAGNKDQANERLDDDLANYFAKNAVVAAEGQAAEGKEVAKVEEEKKE